MSDGSGWSSRIAVGALDSRLNIVQVLPHGLAAGVCNVVIVRSHSSGLDLMRSVSYSSVLKSPTNHSDAIYKQDRKSCRGWL